MAEEEEVWREIADLPGYLVSNKGRVAKADTGQIMKLGTNNGYQRIVVAKNVHRLVAQAFLPAPDDPAKMWVDHIDGNKANNDVSNLRWVTPSENATAYGYSDRIRNKMRPVKAVYLNGEEMVFESRQAVAAYFHCSDSEVKYGHRYTRGRKKGWIFEKLKI